MIQRKQAFNILKVVTKKTLYNIPEILAAIPATAVVGELIVVVKKIYEDTKNEEMKVALDKIIKEKGGPEAFLRLLIGEVKEESDPDNPKYINCAIFMVEAGKELSDEEKDKLVGVLTGEIEAGTNEISEFVDDFRDEYFCGDYESCDYPIEIDDGYIAFNFDDCSDHDYSEDDLKLIMNKMNAIVGREAFYEYEGAGTDDSVDEFYGN